MTFTRFSSLTLSNFMAVQEEQTLDLGNQGLTLIEGRNGSGKSSIIDGFFWTLFGKPLRKLGSVDKVVHRWTGKDCMGKLCFEVGSTKFELTRYRAHKTHKNKVYLLADGNDITRKDVVDEQVVEILGGLDFKTAARTLVFSKRDLVSFSALPDSEQKAIFEKLLGVEELSAACERAQELAREQHRELEATTREMEHNEALQQSTHQLVESLRRSRDAFREKQALNCIELRQALDTEARSAVLSVGEYQETKERLVKAKQEFAAALKEKQAAEEAAEEARERMQKCSDERTQALSALEFVQHRHTDLEERLSPLVGSDACPLCNTTVSKEQKKGWKAQLAKLAADQEVAKARFGNAHKTLDMHTSANVKAVFARTAAQQRVMNAKQKVTKYEEDLTESRDAKKLLRERLEALEAKLAKVKAEAWGQADELVVAKEQEQTLVKRLGDNRLQIKKLTRRVKYTEFWVDGFGRGGLPTDLIDAVLPLLTQKAQTYLNRVSGGTIAVSFDTQRRLGSGETRDKFQVLVSNEDGADSYGGNSSGELARVDLAVSLALQDLAAMRAHNSTNVSFFDEVFDSLDAESINCVSELLLELAKEKESLFVISHLDVLKGDFPHVISVAKVGHQTRWGNEG
jgi:exonuclease SbcC